MKTFAIRILSIGSRIYDILAIILFGIGGNLLVGSGGSDFELWLLGTGCLCILSGSKIMRLRSKCFTIETNVDAKRLLNLEAMLTKSALMARNVKVPPDIDKRAQLATNTRKADLTSEISDTLVVRKEVTGVLKDFIFSGLFAIAGIYLILKCQYVTQNENISQLLNTNSQTTYQKVTEQIANLSKEIVNLSVMVKNQDNLAIESLKKGQMNLLKELEALQNQLQAIATNVDQLENNETPLSKIGIKEIKNEN